VAKVSWNHLSEILGTQIGTDFESVARWWVSEKKNSVLNTCSAALLWSLWKLRNDLCFQEKKWRDERMVLSKLVQTLKNWLPLCQAGGEERLKWVIGEVLAKSLQPLRLMGESWEIPRTHTQSALAPMSSKLVTSREVSRGTSEASELLPVSVSTMAFSVFDLCSFSGRASNTFI
jgi:hypothetical protein